MSSTTENLHEPQEEAAHVFVVHGDLSQLACDAWMLPTDEELRVEPNWNVAEILEQVRPSRPENWSNYGLRVLRVDSWPAERSPAWLVNVGGIRLPLCELCRTRAALVKCPSDQAHLCQTCDELVHQANELAAQHVRQPLPDVDWYVEGARQFLHAVAAHLKGTQPRNGRYRHLVALPLVGTGKGGAADVVGGVVLRLLPALYAFAKRERWMDLALVTLKRPTFAAIQLARRRHFEREAGFERALTPALRSAARRLAEEARRGNLVLFLGSGISAGAGLPTWSALVEDLARQSGMQEEELRALRRLDLLDQARVVELRLGGQRALGRKLAERLRIHSFSLTCALLAGLPVQEVVTTNFNEMFERASRSIGLQTAVLPYAPASPAERWILKMHGSTHQPDDIVITREDYMRYASRRSALRGIVQSLLFTRHMLFVGFSLNDDNFHRIVDEVRQARPQNQQHHQPQPPAQQAHPQTQMPPAPQSADSPSPPLPPPPPPPHQAPPPSEAMSIDALPVSSSSSSSPSSSSSSYVTGGRFGTALSLQRNRLTEVLWGRDLDIVWMEDGQSESLHASAARRLEIFLDLLLMEATSAGPFLLRREYAALLSTEQRALARALSDFIANMPAEARRAPEWVQLRATLVALGASNVDDPSRPTSPDDVGPSWIASRL